LKKKKKRVGRTRSTSEERHPNVTWEDKTEGVPQLGFSTRKYKKKKKSTTALTDKKKLKKVFLLWANGERAPRAGGPWGHSIT